MTPKLMQKIQELWDKHAQPDRHGYKDWMGNDGFEAACRDLVPDWNNYPALKPEHLALHYVVLMDIKSGKRWVDQLFWNGDRWVHPGGRSLGPHLAITYWMPIDTPELP